MEAALESQGIDVVIATEIVVYHALQTKKETNWIESNADCCCTSVTTFCYYHSGKQDLLFSLGKHFT